MKVASPPGPAILRPVDVVAHQAFLDRQVELMRSGDETSAAIVEVRVARECSGGCGHVAKVKVVLTRAYRSATGDAVVLGGDYAWWCDACRAEAAATKHERQARKLRARASLIRIKRATLARSR